MLILNCDQSICTVIVNLCIWCYVCAVEIRPSQVRISQQQLTIIKHITRYFKGCVVDCHQLAPVIDLITQRSLYSSFTYHSLLAILPYAVLAHATLAVCATLVIQPNFYRKRGIRYQKA